MIFRLASLAEVFVWRVVGGETHTVIVLPCVTIVTAYHLSLHLLFFCVLAADASDDCVFLFLLLFFFDPFGFGPSSLAIAFAFRRSVCGGVAIFGVLALRCATRTTCFFCRVH